MIVRIVGFLLLVTTYMVGLGANAFVILDIRVAILVLGMTVGAFLIAAGSSARLCLRALWSDVATEPELLAGAHALQHARWGALVAGFLAATSGVVIVLADFDDPAAVGPGVGLILVGLFWGITSAQALLLPLQARLELKLSLATGADVRDGTLVDVLLVAIGFLFTSVIYAILTGI